MSPTLKVTRKNHRKPGDVPISASVTTLEEKPKRGRRTIPDNFLLGSRNQWAALLEESWPEIGWSLLSISKRRNSTAEDILTAFEPVKQNPHNSGLAKPFYRESSGLATPGDVRNNTDELGRLQSDTIRMRAKRDELQSSRLDVETALRTATLDNREMLQKVAAERLLRLERSEDSLKKVQHECAILERKIDDQEAYIFRSEVLNFLRSGRYAVTPKNLADAIAGLPRMKWRQSFVRCSGMPSNLPRTAYLVLEAISDLWDRRREEFAKPPLDFFRAEILKLSKKKFGNARRFLCENWYDLRLVVEECWKSKLAYEAIPFVLTSALMRSVTRQKEAAERILAEEEKLEAQPS